jgi:hypothetical protein
VDIEADGVPYGVEAVLIRTARLRTRTVIQSVQRRTIDRFDGFKASALVFEGSGWIQRRLGSDFGLEGVKNGPDRSRTLADRQGFSYACFCGLYGLQKALNGSVAAPIDTE